MTATEQDISPRDFKRVADALYAHCGINLGDSKKQLVSARLAKRVRTTGAGSYGQYLDNVLSAPDSEEFTTFVDSLSTNLTSFFREADHFTYLKTTLLPRIVAQRGSTTRSLRAWSAGCSTGEEPYTIMITLLESLPQSASWDIKLLATDLSTRVLSKAAAGVYESERVASVSPQLKAKYFEPRKLGDGESAFAVTPVLRERIAFRYLNLMEPWPFTGPFDFIFCRNVMIYFDKQTQEKLVNRYYECLAPGGVLFTGHSESLTGINHPFKYTQATIYQK
jgi:chemotaxis protein methyltransferase CheR